ncbi:hypothetical protein A5791_20795 [Mycobacterium sp. 852002-51163_SCH5372311]|uniref:hypothetical protein n=1 Tax=Mycobacterium sp. 852002-51163_SCH5372311 TaxID=1834097 RepID=UPI0007FFD6D8|nr:hypothetical protein [Mycobacterium sp. 852002-51163_SCH5372311]OBF86272.1 hypothetical protein A5791_20795 [Mycobacterium sp. 852002-51163_SCH5372311]
MNSSLDTALTIAGFVLCAGVLAFCVPWGLAMSGISAADESQDRPPRSLRENAVSVAAVVVPPALFAGIGVAAASLACLAAGPTFYYPLVALGVGVAVWYGAIVGLAAWHDKVKRGVLDAYVKEEPPRRTAEEAIAAVRNYIRDKEIDYPTTGLAADRFPLGWSVYAPAHLDTRDPAASSGTTVFLVGDSGRIQQQPPSTPLHSAQRRFTAQESLMEPFRGRWLRRRR